MKQAILSAGIISLFAFCITAYAAGDIQAGKAKAVACVGCHGATGDGVAPNPPLANRTEEEIVQALKDYKSGKRVNATMKMMAGTLNEQDAANVAAYFPSLKKK